MAAIPKTSPLLPLQRPAPAKSPGGADQARLSRLRHVAQEFESLLVGQLMRGLRATVPSSGLIDDEGDIKYYRQMYDDELSRALSRSGRGLGIADMIIRQYAGGAAPGATGAAVATAALRHPEAGAEEPDDDAWPLTAGVPVAIPRAPAPAGRAPADAVSAVAGVAARAADTVAADPEAATQAAMPGEPAASTVETERRQRGLRTYLAQITAEQGAAGAGEASAITGGASDLRRVAESMGGAVADTLRRFQPEIDRASRNTGVDPALLLAVLVHESGGDPDARSPRGALGLMQLMPDTAAEVGVRQPLQPGQNILGGARYLSRLLSRFDQSLDLALAGYNAGPGAVSRYGGQVPPYAETREYVRKVSDLYERLRAAGGTDLASGAEQP